MQYEKQGRHLLEWENQDLSLSELRAKREAAWEGKEDLDIIAGVQEEIDDRLNESRYTQLKLKPEYRAKLKRLANKNNRSMANMVEVLIDKAC